MPTQVQFRRGSESQNDNFLGSSGELSVNTDNNSLRVHDGVTTGGHELAKADLSNISTSTGITTLGVTSATNLTVQQLNVSGISTFSGITTHTASLFGTQASFTGVVTASSFSGNASSATYATSSGIATYATNAGIATYATNAGIATSVIGGIGSVTQLSVSGITTLGVTSTTNLTTQQLNVSGISTLGTVQISSGIITAISSGIVTYYGDGSKLTGVIAASGVVIKNNSSTVGVSSVIDFSSGLSVAFASGIATVTVIGGGGGGTIGINTNTTNANQFIPYSVSTGSTTGLGVTSLFVFNPSTSSLGIGTTNPTSKLHVVGNVLVSGVVTASSFSGNASSATYATNAGYASTSGIATVAQGLTGTPNIAVGIVTATSYNGSGSNLTGIVTSITAGSGISIDQSTGNVTITNTGGGGGGVAGITIRDEGNLVGTAGSITILNFVGGNITATASGTASTITISNQTYVENAGFSTSSGISTSVIGGIGSITSLSVSGLSTFSGITTHTAFLFGTQASFTGVVTASSFSGNASSATYATNAGLSSETTKLQSPRTFEITGDIIASPISFDGTGNVSLAATIQPNSIGLGTDTFGNYVKDISGTSNQITVSSGSGEGSSHVISLPSNVIIPSNLTVTTDLQVNNNLNVIGNITVGGTTAYLITNELRVKDKDIVVGVVTDTNGNDVSTDFTASHGGIAVASTEGSPLVYFPVGFETTPHTYKKIMWFKSGSWSGFNTDAWLFNYSVGIGSTQLPDNTRLAVGSVQFTEDSLVSVKNINASGITTIQNDLIVDTDVLYVNSFTNRVGVGTTNPQYKLDVSGDINFSGAFYQNGSPFVASRWTSGTGDNIYRLNGNVGVGTTNPVEKLQVNGYISIDNNVSYGTTVASTSSVSQVGIHSELPIATYRSVEYTIQASRGTDFHTTKILSVHNGTSSYNSEYGTIFNNVILADYNVDISGGNIRLLATPSSSGITTYKVLFNSIKL